MGYSDMHMAIVHQYWPLSSLWWPVQVKSKEEAEDIFSDAEDTDPVSKTPVDRRELLHKAALPKPQVDPANELDSEVRH